MPRAAADARRQEGVARGAIRDRKRKQSEPDHH
jgi:hypothetical protein